MCKNGSIFVGRERELNRLKKLQDKRTSSLLTITGRRRIGKSRLLEEFGANFARVYNFSGLAPTEGVSAEDQRGDFLSKLSQYFNWPILKRDSWSEIFSLLAKETGDGSVLIVLDEISWMAHEDKLFLAQLKNAWDLEFKKNPNLILALCGSVSSWVNKNILESTGFVGRISETIHLEEIALSSCGAFWGDREQNISAQEKLRVLSVTGGVPRYLEEIISSESAEEIILRICFSKSGFLFNEFEKLFSDLFSSKQEEYRRILSLLSKSHMSREAIVEKGESQGGGLSERLDELLKLGFVSRDFTWDISTGGRSKLSKFRLRDNYSRFYLKYLLPHRERILEGTFPDLGLDFLPNWEAIMGLQFENMVLSNKQKIFSLLGLDRRDVINSGSFFQTKTSTRLGCQIDLLIQSRFNSLYLCEVKNKNKEVGLDVVAEVEKKIQALARTRSFSLRPVLISAGEVSSELRARRFFDKIVTGDDLLA